MIKTLKRNVLVIYRTIPEEIAQTIVPMTEEEYIFFKKAHGIIINHTEETSENIENFQAAEAIAYNFATADEKRYYGKLKNSDTYLTKYSAQWVDKPHLSYIYGCVYMISTGFEL